MDYALIVQRTGNGWGASIPDLPGCIAVGDTRAEVLQLIEEAADLHLAAMRRKGLPIPKPTTLSGVLHLTKGQAAQAQLQEAVKARRAS